MPPSISASIFPHVTGARPSMKSGACFVSLDDGRTVLVSTTLAGAAEVHVLKFSDSGPVWTKPPLSGVGLGLVRRRAVAMDFLIGNRKAKFLVIFGGRDARTGDQPLTSLQTLDLQTWKFQNVRSLSGVCAFPREGHGMEILGPGKILVFGGSALGRALDDVWLLEISSPDGPAVWTEVAAKLPQPLSEMGWCRCGSEIFIYGGKNSRNEVSDKLFKWDSAESTGTWKFLDQYGHRPGPCSSERGNLLSYLNENEIGNFVFRDDALEVFVFDRKYGFWSRLEVSDLPPLTSTVWGWTGWQASARIGNFLHENEIVVLSAKKFQTHSGASDENTHSAQEELHKALFVTRKLVAAKEEYLVEMGANLAQEKKRSDQYSAQIRDLTHKLTNTEAVARGLQAQVDSVGQEDAQTSDRIRELEELVILLTRRGELADEAVGNVRKFLASPRDLEASEKLKLSLVVYRDALFHEQSDVSKQREQALRASLGQNCLC